MSVIRGPSRFHLFLVVGLSGARAPGSTCEDVARRELGAAADVAEIDLLARELIERRDAAVGTNDFDGCPAHLPVINGQKMVALDIAAWSDLWFYSNPIYIEVKGGTRVAGVN